MRVYLQLAPMAVIASLKGRVRKQLQSTVYPRTNAEQTHPMHGRPFFKVAQRALYEGMESGQNSK